MSTSTSTDNFAPHLSRFGLTAFRPGQQDVIQAVLDGEDCLCIMPTGGGKSLCYQLPSVVRPGVTLVVSPLIALMKDQVDALQKLGIRASFINSSLSSAEQDARLGQLAAGQFDLLYVAPERFRSPRFLEAVRSTEIQLLAVDEAHCISEWGHDFRHDYARLGQFRQRLGNPQTIALTATATLDVRQDVARQLELRDHKTFVAGFARPNLFYEVQRAPNQREKRRILCEFIRETEGAGIIYAATRKACEEVAEAVQDQLGRQALIYHGGMPMEDRRLVQDRFMRGRAPIVVATNAFGMGIDKADVRFVVHYHMPGSVEAYYQEAGRAGRDGKPSRCLLLYAPSDRYIQEFFIESAYPPVEVIGQVYEFLRTQEEDPIELTQDDLKSQLGLSIGAEGVGTCERLLEKCGVLERLEPNRNMAAVRIESDVPTLVDLLPKQAQAQRAVARAVEQRVGNRRYELVYLRPHDLADAVGMDVVAVQRALRELTRLKAFDYIPPFRGRAVRMLRRDQAFEQLEIDFTEIDQRRQFNLEKLDRMIRFATTWQCRQQVILEYFGQPQEEGCGHCDNCGGGSGGAPVQAVESSSDEALTQAVVKTLSGVARARGRFGKQIIAAMLCGSRSAKITKWKLDQLSTFGLLAQLRQSDVVELIEALLQVELVQQDEANRFRPVVRLTPLGVEVMRGDRPPPPIPLSESACTKIQRAHRAVARAATQVSRSDERSGRAANDPAGELGPPNGVPDRQVVEHAAAPDRSSEASGVARPAPTVSAGNAQIRPDYYWTWRLLSDGYSLPECRAIRQIPDETVLDHLLRAVDDGLPVSLDWILPAAQITRLQQAFPPEGAEGETATARSVPGFQPQHVQLFLRCQQLVSPPPL